MIPRSQPQLSTANTWTAPQTYQAIDAGSDAFFSFKADASDTTSSQFRWIGRTTIFAGTKNFVVKGGFNIAPSGGAVDAAKPILTDEWEPDYNTGTRRVVERMISFTAPGRPTQRPIGLFLDWQEAAPSVDGNSLAFNIEQLFQNDGLGTTRIFTSDKVSGFVSAYPGRFESSLYCNAPSGTNQYTMGIAQLYNGAIKSGFQSRGALYVNPDDSHTDYSATFRNGVGALGPLYCTNSDASPLFYLNNSGHIHTNQRAAATGPVGTVTGKMPVYNTSGVLQGYVPIYDAIT